MFVLTALVYPCVLALLCVGAGLLVDRASGGWLPGMLLGAIGAAGLIAVSQLTTYATVAAPATPYALAVLAVAGYALGWRRVQTVARGWRRHRWQLAVPVLAYAVALAPVLAAGRPTFSSFQSLTDSALHMLGADYLMRHGQDYAGLDLRNSYGQYIKAYYGTSYPSGADTLFGGSAFVLGLPLIWTLQPFTAFMLATAAGPAWVLARRMGLAGGWAAVAALTATVPALVYGYELVASVKEIVALSMIVTLGALVVLHARWLRGSPTRAIPFAIVLAGGVAALGVGFGAWALAAVAVLGAIAIRDVMAGRQDARRLWALIAAGTAVMLVGALSTWVDVAGSLHVAQKIATTSNPGNLQAALKPVQMLGTWLVGSYQQVPTGGLLTVSYTIAALTLAAAVLGAVRVVYMGEYALAGWVALMVAVAVGASVYATTWVNAKAIMLTSPVVVLLAWAGIAGLRTAGSRTAGPRTSGPRTVGPRISGPRIAGPRASPRRTAPRAAGLALALALAGGIAVSDAMQYHDSDLAPTARYEELASLNARFAGRGPTLMGDFDEYALYELRDLDVGGLDFMYPPAGLRLTPGHGAPIDLDRVPPAALAAYPLIVTRRDPTASEPPSAYRMVWQGTYYQVWERRPGAPAAIAHLGLSSTRPVQCSRVRSLAQIAGSHGAQLVAASPPELVMVDIASARHPTWTYTNPGLEMSGSGELQATFELPRAGVWELWLDGETMPTVSVSVDGRALGSIGGQLDGNPHNPDAMTPVRVVLSAGRHRLIIARGASDLAPGEGGWAILHEVVLAPADADTDTLGVTPPARWRSLCGRRFDWIEVVRE
jgi:hypothetical protein